MTADGSQLPFTDPDRERYFEDYVAGEVHELGTVSTDADEIVAFARLYDPQSIHTDPEKAAAGPFGGLIASGWQTAGLMMRLYARHYLSEASSLASPGMEELGWLMPVRPDDVLSVRVKVIDTKRSRSKPDRGVVRSEISVTNQHGDTVMRMRGINMIRCRDGVQG